MGIDFHTLCRMLPAGNHPDLPPRQLHCSYTVSKVGSRRLQKYGHDHCQHDSSGNSNGYQGYP